MIKRETYMIGENEFLIEEFNPMKGLAILRELLTQSFPTEWLTAIGVPAILGNFVAKPNDQPIDVAVENFTMVQAMLLQNVKFKSGTDFVPILDSAKNFKVEIDQFDTLRLYAIVMKLNYASFFIKCRDAVLDKLTEMGVIEKLDIQGKVDQMEDGKLKDSMDDFMKKFFRSEAN